jgi:hypothetical protein
MLQKRAELKLPFGEVNKWFIFDDLIIAVEEINLHVTRPSGGEWKNVKLPSDIISVVLLPGEDDVLLVGLASGELIGISLLSDVQPTEPILIKENVPINSLHYDESLLYIQVGDNLLITLLLEALTMSLHHPTDITLKDNGCYYELPTNRVDSMRITTDELVDGWPEQNDSKSRTKLILTGQGPMLSIVSLPPISEALLDPVGLAADFISSTVSNWLFSSKQTVSPKRKALLDRLPRGHATVLMTLDDSERSITEIIPTTGNHYILLDEQHGRALLFDPHCGIIRRQIKGLRGCQLSVIDGKLVALQAKRSYIDIIDIANDGNNIRHDLPPAPLSHHNLLPSKSMKRDNDNVITFRDLSSSSYYALLPPDQIIFPDLATGSLIMYKLTL